MRIGRYIARRLLLFAHALLRLPPQLGEFLCIVKALARERWVGGFGTGVRFVLVVGRVHIGGMILPPTTSGKEFQTYRKSAQSSSDEYATPTWNHRRGPRTSKTRRMRF